MYGKQDIDLYSNVRAHCTVRRTYHAYNRHSIDIQLTIHFQLRNMHSAMLRR